MKLTRDRLLRAVLLGAALFMTPVAAPVAMAADGGPGYVRMRLARGVEVEIPQAWHATTDQTGTPQGIHDNQLRAHLRAGTVSLVNAWTGEDGIDASTGIQSSVPPAWTPQRVSRLKPAEIGTLGNVMERQLSADLKRHGLKMVRFLGSRLDTVGGHPAVVTEFVRSSTKGDTVEQINHVFTPRQAISFILSYREADAETYKPVMNRIRESLVVRQ